MPGSLQGDFTRFLSDSDPNDSAVRLQQGRVLLDSDWNAHVDLLGHLRRTLIRDLVGPAGGPADYAGFEILSLSQLSFDGGDRYMVLGGAGFDALRGAPALTFEAWLRPRRNGPAVLLSRYGRDKADDDFAPQDLLEILDDGRLALRQAAAAAPDLVTRTALTPDQLHHLAVTYTGDSAGLWLDGVSAGRAARGFLGEIAETALVFGAELRGDKAEHGFEGILDAVRLWRQLRTVDELTAPQAQEPPTSEREPDGSNDNLVGTWTFDTPTNSVADRTGNGPRWVLGGGRPAHRPTYTLAGLRIGAGRYYVDGILAENPAEVAYAAQPDLPDAVLPDLQIPQIFYLDVWERSITYNEDPRIREVALDGPDTTTRSRTVAQVRSLPLDGMEGMVPEKAVLRRWEDFLATRRRHGHCQARRQPSAMEIGNFLYRVEIHTPGGALRRRQLSKHRSSPRRAGVLTPIDTKHSSVVLTSWPNHWRVGDRVEIVRTDGTQPESTSAAGTQPAVATATITALDPSRHVLELGLWQHPFPDGGLSGEVHLRRIATFKWSRSNASEIYPLIDPRPGSTSVLVRDDGSGEIELEKGDWVEFFNQVSALTGATTPLFQVLEVDRLHWRVTLDRAPVTTGPDAALPAPALRRWDQHSEIGGVLEVRQGWTSIESGIEVFFLGDADYQASDYWLIPARTDIGGIEWPQADGEPLSLMPHGIDHSYALLAVLWGSAIYDWRKIFKPLARYASTQSEKADEPSDPVFVPPGSSSDNS